MKRSSEAVLQLMAELESDYAYIHESAVRNEAMVERLARTDSPDEFDYAAHGYTLHNLYNAFEAYFLRVAKFFENGIGESGRHRFRKPPTELQTSSPSTTRTSQPSCVPWPWSCGIRVLSLSSTSSPR